MGTRKDLLMRHFINIHQPRKNYNCEKCNYCTHRKIYLLEHVKIHSNRCKFCSRKFRKESTLKKHVHKMHPWMVDSDGKVSESIKKVKKEYKCSICSYKTKIKCNWDRHKSRPDHLPNWKPKPKRLQCNKCYKKFPLPSRLHAREQM